MYKYIYDSQAVAAEDVAEMLIKCITCAVLARSGPPRDRLVETLFKVHIYAYMYICMHIAHGVTFR
jgi:hypothetical protein